MKAVRLEAVGQIFLRDLPKPIPGPLDLLVRVEASGICGTDRHLLHGEFPCTPPITLGHEFSGIIEAMGAAVSGFSRGMRVTGDPNIACGRCSHCHAGRINLCRNLRAIGIHLDGGLAEYVLVPQAQAHALPMSLKATHGAFCEPLACCLHGIDIAQVRAGSSVMVLGGGVIGLLVVQLARLAGATQVLLSTRQAAKRALGEALGATASIDPSDGQLVANVIGPNGLLPGGADVVIECAGVADTMEQMCSLARPGGTVVILGVIAKGAKIVIEPFDVLFRELRILGSFINPFTHHRAAELVASGALELDALVTRQISLDEAPDVIAKAPTAGEVKVMYVG